MLRRIRLASAVFQGDACTSQSAATFLQVILYSYHDNLSISQSHKFTLLRRSRLACGLVIPRPDFGSAVDHRGLRWRLRRLVCYNHTARCHSDRPVSSVVFLASCQRT
jgi:hypothetical protein